MTKAFSGQVEEPNGQSCVACAKLVKVEEIPIVVSS